jgi:23S rRNA-/tRNA-specific pseudouridylate synthase
MKTAYNAMKKSISEIELSKRFITRLVQGHVDPSEGTIDAPIGTTSAERIIDSLWLRMESRASLITP